MNSGPADSAPLEVFAARRRALAERVGDAIVVLVSLPELRKSRDTDVNYRQASDLYYFTGILEPEAAAILDPAAENERFTVFMRPRDASREVWTGYRIGVEAAREKFGADASLDIAELEDQVATRLKERSTVVLPLGSRPALDARVFQAIEQSRFGRQRTGKGIARIVDLESVTNDLRLIKDQHEIERMRAAGRISAAAHRAAMARAIPGCGEWEIQAALEGRMRELGADGPAFPSIVAGGANATVLHYVDNNARVPDDALVLVDAGAEWGMYAGDITRTFPVSGRFSAVQKELYEIVLAAEEAAIEAIAPGEPVDAVHKAAVRVITQGLLDIGILQGMTLDEAIEQEAHKPFFLHQTSHWLGLDVHDVGLYAREGEPIRFEPGMVLTVEPGVYFNEGNESIPERFRGIGIRIEDDVLVTSSGFEILTRDVPVDPDEVEALVGSAHRVASTG